MEDIESRVNKLEHKVVKTEAYLEEVKKDIYDYKIDCPLIEYKLDVNRKFESSDRVFSNTRTVIITIGILIVTAIGNLQVTKVSHSDLKEINKTQREDQIRRDERIQSIYENQQLLQREIMKELTELKVNIASLNTTLLKEGKSK